MKGILKNIYLLCLLIFRDYFICNLYMSDWFKYLQIELEKNPGKPLKEVIEIAKINIKKLPIKKSKKKSKKK